MRRAVRMHRPSDHQRIRMPFVQQFADAPEAAARHLLAHRLQRPGGAGDGIADGHADAARAVVESEDRAGAAQAYCAARSGMPRRGRQQRRIDAEHLVGLDEALLGGRVEEQRRIRRHRQPGVLADLRLQLARSPAGVAECNQEPLRVPCPRPPPRACPWKWSARSRGRSRRWSSSRRAAGAARSRDRSGPGRRRTPACDPRPTGRGQVDPLQQRASVMVVGLFSTRPSAPRSLCSATRTTAPLKFGSAMFGIASRK